MIYTLLDLCLAVEKLSQHCEKPLKYHWTAVKRIYRYPKGTKIMGIEYGGSTSSAITGFCDSDWAGCMKSIKSTEAFVFPMTRILIFWRSKKKSVVVLSFCEAEYISCCSSTKKSMWLFNVHYEMLCTKTPIPITIFMDNQGSIRLSNNMYINTRNKHIDIRYHVVREAVAKKNVSLAFVPTTYQPAGILTKPLLLVLYQKLRDIIGIVEQY